MLRIYRALRGAKLDAVQMDGRYVYIIIYKENSAQQYNKCGSRSGLPQLAYIIIFHSYTPHIHVYNYSLSKVSILE